MPGNLPPCLLVGIVFGPLPYHATNSVVNRAKESLHKLSIPYYYLLFGTDVAPVLFYDDQSRSVYRGCGLLVSLKPLKKEVGGDL